MKRWRHYKKNHALVLACFGSVHSVQNYEFFYEYIKKKFSEFDVFLSFSSRTILKKLANEKIIFKNLPQTLSDLDFQGYRKVTVVSVNLFPTNEHSQLEKIVQGFKLFTPQQFSITPPIISRSKTSSEFIFKTHKMLKDKYPKHSTLYIVHGSPQLNQTGVYAIEYMRNFLKELDSTTEMFSLEGIYPVKMFLESYLQRLKEQMKIKKVLLIPFLLVSGIHFKDDITEIKEEIEKYFSVDFPVLDLNYAGLDRNFHLLNLSSTLEIFGKEIQNSIKRLN